MDAPPPKPKPKKETPEDLAEVERALSVLKGRHPESERLRREDEERLRERRAEQEAIAAAEARRVRSRRLVIGAAGSVVVVVLVAVAMLFRSEIARRSQLERATDPYRAMGFVVVEASSRGSPPKVEADVPAGCLLATSTSTPFVSAGGASASASPVASSLSAGNASSKPARLRITYPGGVVEGAAPVVACLCEPGHVTLTADAGVEGGLALLRADATTVGGSRAFAFLPFQPGTVGRTDQACAEASLDAWLDSKRNADGSAAARPGPMAPVDKAASNTWLAQDASRRPLRDVGFEVIAMVRPGLPFAVVDLPAKTCVLALPESEADRPSVRLRGGSLAVGPAAGGVAWCTSSQATVVVQREQARGADADRGGDGGGAIAVLRAPAARVGGLLGLREVAARAGVSLGAVAVGAGDFGWIAKSILLASAIPEHLITVANAPDLGEDPEARLVALASDTPGMLVADTPPEVFSFCEPALDAATASVCVFSGSQKWHAAGTNATGGIARAKLPFWLFGLKGVTEPLALKLETQLVSLARRLGREGFEPTTIEAVTELDKGAEVLGRAGEDAFVAIGLAPVAPWVLPYTDGPAWTLDGEPRVVPIRPLERVVVTSTAKVLPPKAVRRTVVFRRSRR